MKYQLVMTLLGFFFFSCFTKHENEKPYLKSSTNFISQPTNSKMKIKIGSNTFTATLYENKTTDALKSLLPLTLDMIELNKNEKYAQLPNNIPTNSEHIGTIREGDIMLWGANTLVLFYKTFQTSYKYTKIGKIENPKGLISALGAESITVTLEF